jgi:hypothetical protein
MPSQVKIAHLPDGFSPSSVEIRRWLLKMGLRADAQFVASAAPSIESEPVLGRESHSLESVASLNNFAYKDQRGSGLNLN